MSSTGSIFMSWTDVFPVLGDDLVDQYQTEAAPDEVSGQGDCFTVARKIHCREGRHLVAISFFRREEAGAGRRLSAMGEGSDFQLLVEAAESLRAELPDIVFRVYLAADLEPLAADLAAAGCEIFLMRSSSGAENFPSMWRFLALEETDRWITFSDPGSIHKIQHDVERTAQVMASGLGFWRSPHVVEDADRRFEAGSYRPIEGRHFGSKGGLPVGLLLRAFLWHRLRGTMAPAFPEMDGNPQAAVVNGWETDSVDEGFLMAAVYPRVAFQGVLTFLLWQRRTLTHWHALDIEYVTWANPLSQVFFTRKYERGAGLPWAKAPAESGIEVRPDTEVFSRARKRGCEGPEVSGDPPPVERRGFRSFRGSLPELLDGAGGKVTAKYLVDFDPSLKAGSSGAELFLDRRYEGVDVVVCGYAFIKITAAVSEWARGHGLDAALWGEGRIRKVPKLEGPLTLWRTAFAWDFGRDLASQGGIVGAELLLAAWIHLEKAVLAETTARQMGWKLR